MAASVSVQKDRSAISLIIASPSGPVARKMLQAGNIGRNHAVQHAPVDRGHLKNSITLDVLVDAGHLTVRWGSNLPYAIWVEKGTGIYGPRGAPIRPRRARFLVWEGRLDFAGTSSARLRPRSRRGLIFARQVRGRPATPFLQPSLAPAMAVLRS